MKKFCIVLLLLMMLPIQNVTAQEEVHEIILNSSENSDGTYSYEASIDGNSILEYDYTWNIDLENAHEDVKNSPSEYYTGTAPSDDVSVYIAHDIYYYPELDSSKYVKGVYGDETEWLYYYEIEGYEDYIFATLPVEGSSVPTRMMHSASEAYNNAVLHINEAGTYEISGTWHGQIYIDLGEDSFDDPSAVVTLILNNADIECSVAPGICFYQVYEVDNTWEDRENAISSIDTTGAGACIELKEGSNNTVSGANIYRLLKTKYKDEDSTATIKEQKKSKKVDGALYSYMSLNIGGEGTLNIHSEFEGLDSELHLTINGGNINIISDNDGINVNEDYVSIFTMNAGTLQILAGTGYEGDGIDSNGYICINGGTIIASAKPQSDSGLDSESGTYINGGSVLATGSSMDVVTEYSEDSNQVTLNLVFSSQQDIENSLVMVDSESKAIFGFDLSKNDFFKDQDRTYQCLIVSDDAIELGSTYSLYSGASMNGTQENGIYQTIKSYKNGSALSYSFTGNFRMGMGGTGMNPQTQMPSMPTSNANSGSMDSFDRGQKEDLGQRPENQETEMPTMPEGQEGQMPTMSENQEGGFPDMQGNDIEMPIAQSGMQDSATPPQMPQGDDKQDMNMPEESGNNDFAFADSSTSENTVFTMEDKVNTFSGVSKSTAEVVTNTSNSLSTPVLIGIGVGVLIVGCCLGVLIGHRIGKKKETERQS